MTSEQVIEVGRALLPYLRSDLRPEELGMAAHDAAAALRRSSGLSKGLSDSQRLAISCGNEPYADDKICPTCNGLGNVSAIASIVQSDVEVLTQLANGMGFGRTHDALRRVMAALKNTAQPGTAGTSHKGDTP